MSWVSCKDHKTITLEVVNELVLNNSLCRQLIQRRITVGVGLIHSVAGHYVSFPIEFRNATLCYKSSPDAETWVIFIGNGISIGNKNDQINRNRIGNGVMGTGENDQSNSHSDTYMYSLTVRLWSKCVQLLVYCTKFLLLLLHQSINQFNSNLAAREPDSKWYAVEIIDKNSKRNKQCAHMYLGVGRDV